MKILILGAGYIGEAIASLWTNTVDSFSLTTTTPEKQIRLQSHHQTVYLLKGSEQDKIAQLLNEFDGMIVSVAPGSQRNYEEVYRKTAYSVATALEKRKTPFYLLYTSSTSVYGDHQGKWVDETSSCLNDSPHGQILNHVENIYLDCQNSFVTVCILRLAGIYGPRRELDKRALAMSGKQIEGSGNCPTNHIHRDDVVRAIEFCFCHRFQGIYNLANAEHPFKKELYDSLCHRMHVDTPKWNAESVSLQGSNCYVSSQKIHNKGFKFIHASFIDA